MTQWDESEQKRKDITCRSDWGNKTYMQKFGRLIVDIWPLGRLRSRWENNCQLDQKEIDQR